MASSKELSRLARICAIGLILTLPACEKGTKTKEIEVGVAGRQTTACRVFKELSWSSRDTDQTIKEIKIHNAKYAAVCG